MRGGARHQAPPLFKTESLQIVPEQGEHLVTPGVLDRLTRELEPKVFERHDDGHEVRSLTIDVHPSCGTTERLGHLQEGHEGLLARGRNFTRCRNVKLRLVSLEECSPAALHAILARSFSLGRFYPEGNEARVQDGLWRVAHLVTSKLLAVLSNLLVAEVGELPAYVKPKTGAVLRRWSRSTPAPR